MAARACLHEECAQATVEMAVVTPVLLVLALIVYNIMVYAGAVARFDRVVPDIVLAHAAAPGGEGDDSAVDASARVQAEVQFAMGAMTCRLRCRANRVRRRQTMACSRYREHLGHTPAR